MPLFKMIMMELTIFLGINFLNLIGFQLHKNIETIFVTIGNKISRIFILPKLLEYLYLLTWTNG